LSNEDISSPVLPDYGGASLPSLFAALLGRNEPDVPKWLPGPVRGAEQVLLLVLDGLGWHQLRKCASVSPVLSSAEGAPITSVVPTTTATALTSITTGRVPAEHGVVGYRMLLQGRTSASSGRSGGRGLDGDDVLNVLRWSTRSGDMRQRLPATSFQPLAPFGSRRVPAVTRAEFGATGFTALHLAGARLIGWSVPSTLVVHARELLRAGERFVYAYYDGLDKVAHAYGLGAFYEEELRAVDALVAALVSELPKGAAMVVTSDHGQVDVGQGAHLPDPGLLSHTSMLTGEGRFRWLHARPGAMDDLLAATIEAHSHEAWVVTKDEIVDAGWFGGPLSDEVKGRLGDVALVARDDIAFLDPADTGETTLAARHGSLTPAEMYVPLLAWAGS
jgi:predicted AlkP superfamily pyrophosphatase or phosphodiesterase